MNWYLDVVQNKYMLFHGRAHRTEYWMFTLFNVIIMVVLGVVEGIMGIPGILGLIYALAVLLPSIGVSIRRLHDTNRSAWWLLIALVPLVGAIVLIIFFIMESTPGDNQYGPQPV